MVLIDLLVGAERLIGSISPMCSTPGERKGSEQEVRALCRTTERRVK